MNILEGNTGKKAWVRVGIMRASKGGKMAYVDGMIRLSKEKGLKPRKVAVDKPLTVYVAKVGWRRRSVVCWLVFVVGWG